MRHTPPSHKKRTRKLLPVPVVALIDVVAAGACLCIFSLFHHVLPRVSDFQGTPISRPPVSDGAGASSSPSSTDATQPPSPTGWAAKWPDKFSDTVVKTANSYRSKDVSVEIQRVEENGVVYFVTDIYVNSIDNLRAGLAKDKFGQGLRESVQSMSQRLNAIVAINGDYYGNRTIGPVVRNGILYRESPFEDACVLYSDGVMETYAAEELDMEAAKQRGAYQIWSFGPQLLDKNGKAFATSEDFVSTVKGANPRSAIGYYEPGHYCTVLVEGRQAGYSKGMSMVQLSQLFESLGCKAAYNFDGGRSSVMTFMGEVYNQPANGGRSNSDMFYVAELE